MTATSFNEVIRYTLFVIDVRFPLSPFESSSNDEWGLTNHFFYSAS